MVVKTTPTRGTLFARFMRGNKKQTGNMKRNSFGLSGEALHAVMEDLEYYWGRIKSEEHRKEI